MDKIRLIFIEQIINRIIVVPRAIIGFHQLLRRLRLLNIIIIIFTLVKIVAFKFLPIIRIPIGIQIVYLDVFAIKFSESYSDEIPCILNQ